MIKSLGGIRFCCSLTLEPASCETPTAFPLESNTCIPFSDSSLLTTITLNAARQARKPNVWLKNLQWYYDTRMHTLDQECAWNGVTMLGVLCAYTLPERGIGNKDLQMVSVTALKSLKRWSIICGRAWKEHIQVTFHSKIKRKYLSVLL